MLLKLWVLILKSLHIWVVTNIGLWIVSEIELLISIHFIYESLQGFCCFVTKAFTQNY